MLPAEPDPRVLKLLRDLDAERTARKAAERRAAVLAGVVKRMAKSTKDAKPKQEQDGHLLAAMSPHPSWLMDDGITAKGSSAPSSDGPSGHCDRTHRRCGENVSLLVSSLGNNAAMERSTQ
jgi:hypothetical protein